MLISKFRPNNSSIILSSPEISFELPDEASVLSPVSSLIECNKPANRSLNRSCNNLEKLFKLKSGRFLEVVTKLNNRRFVLYDFLTTKYLKKPSLFGPCQGAKPDLSQ